MGNGYAWAGTDACVILKGHQKVMKEKFVAVKLQLPGSATARIVHDDSNVNVLDTQKYEWTNVKREFTMYYADGVFMLSGEYKSLF